MNTYYRTSKGSHRHLDRNCANFRRSISLGDVIELTAAEAAEFAPCEVCTTETERVEFAEKAEAKAETMCSNPGVRKPKHIESECRECGKRGKVDRRTGKLRAHKA